MKSTFFTLLLLPLIAFSQPRVGNDQIIYHKDGFGQKATPTDYDSYSITKDFYLIKMEYTKFDYNKSGVLVRETTFKNKKLKDYSPNTKIIEYYDDGKKKSEKATFELGKGVMGIKIFQFWDTDGNQKITDGNGDYFEENETLLLSGKVRYNLKDGTWIDNNKKRKITSTEKYKEGKFISGISVNEEGKEFKYTELEEKPTPKYGMSDFYSHIGKNFKLTDDAIINKISGKIYLQFIVEKNGEINEIKILRGLGYGLDEEAFRAVNDYKKWIPGKQKGIPVRVLYALPLSINQRQ